MAKRFLGISDKQAFGQSKFAANKTTLKLQQEMSKRKRSNRAAKQHQQTAQNAQRTAATNANTQGQKLRAMQRNAQRASAAYRKKLSVAAMLKRNVDQTNRAYQRSVAASARASQAATRAIQQLRSLLRRLGC